MALATNVDSDDNKPVRAQFIFKNCLVLFVYLCEDT
jgi:hypothetical protein